MKTPIVLPIFPPASYKVDVMADTPASIMKEYVKQGTTQRQTLGVPDNHGVII